MKRAILTIVTAAALSSACAEAFEVWAPEYPEGGYSTASKLKAWSAATREQDKDADGLMCWAATTSDLIEYWQRRYEILTGTSLTTDIPHGSENSPRKSAVFDAFVASWENRALGVEPALYWYFSGTDNHSVQAGTGGYWAEYCANLGYSSAHESLLTHSYYSYLSTVLPPSSADSNEWVNVIYGGLGSYISTTLSSGALLALNLIHPNETEAHYVTLYGANYDDSDGTLVGLWIHDNNSSSDDFTYLELATATRIATKGDIDKGDYEEYKYEVLKVTGGTHLDGWTLNGVENIVLAIIPEPSSALLALAALPALLFRRRRRE